MNLLLYYIKKVKTGGKYIFILITPVEIVIVSQSLSEYH